MEHVDTMPTAGPALSRADLGKAFRSDEYAAFRAAILRLSLVSHAPTVSYDGMSRSSTESPGGGRPPGEPDLPRRRDFEDYSENFRQKPAEWFVTRLRREARQFGRGRITVHEFIERVSALTADAERALRDWQRTPPANQAQIQFQNVGVPTLEWRIKIARDKGTSRQIADRYGISHTSVLRYRREYANIDP